MENRIRALQRRLPEGADALLLCDPLNQRYLTGVNFTDGYVLVSADSVLLLADSRYIEAAEATAAEGVEVRLLKAESLKQACTGFARLAFEDRYVTCADLRGLKRLLPEIDFIGCASLLSDLREQKDEGEIDSIVRAQRIAEEAFDHILGFITPERTEIEIALELEFYMRSHGASGISFETIAVSGSASSMPHGQPRDRRVESGFLTMDFGAVCEGYCSDMTRTVVIGKADADMRALYQTVLEAQMAAIDAVAPGKSCREIDHIARQMLNERYPDAFGHGLGHGVGLYIHEGPNLSPRSGSVLVPGNVITIEPGVYLKGRYGVRIEDMLAVTGNGVRNLTKAPKNLIEL